MSTGRVHRHYEDPMAPGTLVASVRVRGRKRRSFMRVSADRRCVASMQLVMIAPEVFEVHGKKRPGRRETLHPSSKYFAECFSPQP